ncbi:MAG: pentapeptide repeat-containing protein [Candidatus Cloacimonetes bacterium]|nr:pentapeptide repeat-containing protein [Candidatus Cloacimonadota bacterium]
MKDICSVTGCNREVFEKGKCIFHCDKDDWFDEIEIYGEKKRDWSRSREKVDHFWFEIRDKIMSNNNTDEYLFEGFIFPEFEKDFDFAKIKNFNKIDKELVFDKKANFKDSIFLDVAYFSDITFQNEVNFCDSEFQDRAHFFNSKFQNKAFFGFSIYNNDVLFSKSTFENKVSFEHSTFQNKFEFVNSVFQNEVSFWGSIFQGKVSFFDASDKKYTKGILKFHSTKFEEKSSLDVRDCDVKSIIIVNLINYSNFLRLTNINVLDNFILVNINLTKFEFHNLNLIKCKTAIENVSFISSSGFAVFNGVKWGDISKTFDKTTDRDTFRQLKYVNEKQGNIIEANKFYSAEMKAYKEELKDKKNKHRWQDRVIFWLNEKVSNFSQNWLKPLGWFFLIGFIAFVFSNFSKIISYLNDTSKITLTTLWNAINQFFKYLNPFNTSAGEWNPVIWLVFKALSIFIIYQFIISLRRQTRR